jgi:uncharacterized protein (DUF2236 family)
MQSALVHHPPLFVGRDSIVRRIWGDGDTILLIFAGAAAEFALNKAVDWLFFTGRLPADPLGRLFSTVSYARRIVFSGEAEALRTIDAMAHIHAGVEEKRGRPIPDWAYRDVLFMLIDYSMRSFAVLERPLHPDERSEVFSVFSRVGRRMGVKGLPDTLGDFDRMRGEHLQRNLIHSHYTDELYRQYRKHLGGMRYLLLREAQLLVVPRRVSQLLGMRKRSLLHPLIATYKLSRPLGLDRLLKVLILPPDYRKEIMELDVAP